MDLHATNPSGIALVGADLSGTQLKQEFLSGVSYDNSTIWPDGFTPPPTPPPSAGNDLQATMMAMLLALGRLRSEIPRPDCMQQ